MKFTLPARKPFKFHSVVHSHGWYQLAPFQLDEETDTLCYVLQLANGRVLELKMREAADGVAVETEKLDKPERKEVTDRIRWMFDLDSDFSHFYAVAMEEPKLARVEDRALGRVLRSPSVFEDVIKTILTTNTLWGATRNMTRKLVNEFGAPLEEQGEKCAFPSPASIAASRPEVLKEKVRVGYRATAIHQLAVVLQAASWIWRHLKHHHYPPSSCAGNC